MALPLSERINDYYPFGLTHNQKPGRELNNKYLYNGKELQDEMGLDVYDFGWRSYDPALGRSWQVDPLADNFDRHSPYSWVMNNPILMIDPTGMASDTIPDNAETKPMEISMLTPLEGLCNCDLSLSGVVNWLQDVYNSAANSDNYNSREKKVQRYNDLAYKESQGKLTNQEADELYKLRREYFFGNDEYFKDHFPNGIYTGGRHEKGQANPPPLNGQEALDNSYSIGPNTDRRVAVSNNQIIILDVTEIGAKTFHGHVRTWEELKQEGSASQKIRNLLIKHGLVNTKGKIVKK